MMSDLVAPERDGEEVTRPSTFRTASRLLSSCSSWPSAGPWLAHPSDLMDAIHAVELTPEAIERLVQQVRDAGVEFIDDVEGEVIIIDAAPLDQPADTPQAPAPERQGVQASAKPAKPRSNGSDYFGGGAAEDRSTRT